MKYLLTFLIIPLLLPFGQLSSQAASERKKTEIVLIASHHVALFLHPRYTLAHVRALLTKIKPDAICIEALSDWEWSSQPIPTFPQEHYATLTWAKGGKVPVYGVDWEIPGEWDKFLASQQQSQSSTTVEKRWARFQTAYRPQVTWESM